jgi:hypothetical protein
MRDQALCTVASTTMSIDSPIKAAGRHIVEAVEVVFTGLTSKKDAAPACGSAGGRIVG